MKKHGITVCPSIASANPLRLAEAVCKVEAAGCTDLHIDIEDGSFIPNITFGQKTVSALRNACTLPFSFHLMTENWQPWLEYAAGIQPSIVFAHLEYLRYPQRFIGAAKKLGVRCGIAVNPITPVEPALYLLCQLDGLLLLAVEPDDMGERFIPDVLDKARLARQHNTDLALWVDGNVTMARLEQLAQHGVTHVVMGRDFFSGGKQDD